MSQGIAPQNRHIASVAEEFLDVHWDKKSPLLLGYSGGPDSKALLYALLECGVKNLHLAHVDHGWRVESCEEAETLREEASRLGCPYHTIRLSLLERGNKEDQSRRGRLDFFRSLFSETPFQALLLAHHGDDLAETVLKRVFEGAHLSHLGGMEPVSKQGSLAVWRPFLKVRRSEILQYLEKKQLTSFQDPTNLDPAYLRSRMRSEIFPYLNELFGKEIVDNLKWLSERSLELKQYLDQKLETARVKKGSWGALLDIEGLHRLERRHAIQRVAREEGLVLTRPVLETVLNWAEEKGTAKSIEIGGRKIFIEANSIFFTVN